MENDKRTVKFRLGCTIPIFALLALLVLLEVITIKMALIVGLSLLIIPLVIYLIMLIILALAGVTVGIVALLDKFKWKRK